MTSHIAAESGQTRSDLSGPPLVHIADADIKTCEALSLLVRLEGFQSTFSCSLPDFEGSLERRPPQAVVVNRAIDPAGPGKTARFVGRFAPGAQIVFLQDAASVDDAVEEMRMGAIDVLVKPIDPERLLRTLRDGFKRDAHLGGVRGGGIRHLHVTGFPTLTNREREVLELIMNGKSNNEAAVDLGISPRTVEVHRARVMKKLGATNSVSLANIFLQATRGY